MEATIQFLRSNNVYVQNTRSISENYEILENGENVESVEGVEGVESVESVQKRAGNDHSTSPPPRSPPGEDWLSNVFWSHGEVRRGSLRSTI